MPEAPPPVLEPAPQDPPDQGRQGRRRQRLPGVRAVDDHDAHVRRQHDPAADRRADRDRVRHRPGGLPQPGRRRRARRDRAALADPGDRRHPLPAEVRLRRDRRRLRRRTRQPRQHPQVRRPDQGDRARREGPRHVDPDRRQRRQPRQADPREVRQGDARGARRVGGLGGRSLRGARLPRLQDLGQAQRPGRHGARLRAARPGRRLAAAPRRHRGRARPSRARSSRRRRSARCSRRASATRSGSRSRLRRSRRSRSASRSCSRSTCGPRKLEIVSCPSCGRAQVDVYTLAEQVTAGLEGMEVPLRVAVMGCVVNGPGEAREADLGVASGNGKGQIFVKGEVIKTVPESQIVETLIEEAMRIAEGMESVDGAAARSPSPRPLAARRPRGPRLQARPDDGGARPLRTVQHGGERPTALAAGHPDRDLRAAGQVATVPERPREHALALRRGAGGRRPRRAHFAPAHRIVTVSPPRSLASFIRLITLVRPSADGERGGGRERRQLARREHDVGAERRALGVGRPHAQVVAACWA